MSVLLINGSPRKNGNTAAAISVLENRFMEHGIETKRFQIENGLFRGCVGCGGCRQTNRCVFKDDICNQLIEDILKSDGIVVGSPVYFAGPNGSLCALLDRAFYATCTYSQLFKGKPAASFVACEWTGGTSALDRLHRYFVLSQMPVISSNDYTVFTAKSIKDKEKRTIEILETLADNMTEFLTGSSKANRASQR